MNTKTSILILYYSSQGATQKMAELIALGVESISNVTAKLRTVPSLHQSQTPNTASSLMVTRDDLLSCSGLILGSPTRFGNISANIQHFLESTLDIWLSGQLIGKPAGVFTSSSTLHGGQESTLLSLLLPLLHHGMIVTGLPYHHPELHRTQTGGSPYGPSHVAGTQGDQPISKDERALCMAFGKRIATIAMRLNSQEGSHT
ncbi:NAD(P)H:quinone oxidoreductase [Candidatus Berkiella cookevillensis]|uniref:NAD(P)H dehydrogenase (Quinone) n=1 Tax=Candidatus Berkiella cookevillensis TaxID=437022 RepID=A0A0Q9Y9G6_9GAMM|nr:NAD(P)H:quinone oxidoreductase [Candidatus Berkiella cookevillensis]MCS5708784.1 NAD(P)H:quinone oxidoreductase [Candidatus Berkiella cookevillensis]